MSTSEWQCDRSIYSNPPNVHDNLKPSEDLYRPWKNYKVPSGSTVGSVLSVFNRGARQQFRNDIQARANNAGFDIGSAGVYNSILKSTPVRTSIGLVGETSFHRTFRPSLGAPYDTEIVKEARSGTSSEYRLTEDGDFAISINWHTECGSCKGDFRSGEKVVEMDDRTWRHYWQYPIYGQPFREIIDVYQEEDEDGVAMRDGLVWVDLTGTRFKSDGRATAIVSKDSKGIESSTPVGESYPSQYQGNRTSSVNSLCPPSPPSFCKATM